MVTINGTTYKSLITHSGTFHADEVACVAILRTLEYYQKQEETPVIRTNKVTDTTDALVFDIGLGEFDHHQPEKSYHANGCPMASFGKIWDYIKDEFELTEEQEAQFEEEFVCPIDEHDSVGIKAERPSQLSIIVSSLNPVWDANPNSADHYFDIAVATIRISFMGWINTKKAQNRAVAKTKEASRIHQHVAILPEYLPIEVVARETDAMALVFPNNRQPGFYTVWSLQRKSQANLKTIADKLVEAGESYYAPDTSTGEFCHPAGFIATFSNKYRAIDFIKSEVAEAELNRCYEEVYGE